MTEGPAPGTRLAHFEVRSLLGQGGMGAVYLAHDPALDREVAVKVLRPEIAGDAKFVERFLREAKAAAKVNHPNLTHVHFVGATDGRPFFAMEILRGGNLEEAVKRDGPFEFRRGLEVLIQAARGLAAAHAAGVVHRDIKPSNLMLLPDGTVKVTDFGLAKSIGVAVDQSVGGLVGTPSYMTPEQCKGAAVDARTDVYALGLTGWFLFAGRPPYPSDQVGQVIHDQIATPLPDLAAMREDLPPGLAAALARMCEKEPAKRPQDMAAVLALLEDLRPKPLHPATLGARLIAAGLDFLVCSIVASLPVALYIALALIIHRGDRSNPEVPWALVLLANLLFPVVMMREEWKGQSSGGKRFLGLAIVRRDGGRPSRRAVLQRLALRYPGPLTQCVFLVPGLSDARVDVGIPLPVASIAWWGLQVLAVVVAAVWYFRVRRGRTLSDAVTGTMVVYRSEFKEAAPAARAGR